MIDTTNVVALNALSVLESLATERMPAKAAFRIYRLVRPLNQLKEDVEKERQKLLNEYAQKTADDKIATGEGNRVLFEPGKELEFIQQFNDVLQAPFMLEALPLTLDTLGNAQVTPQQLFQLGAFFAEE
jgi:hypothetical protein